MITGSILPAVSAQGNMTAGGGGNMTAGGGDIGSKVKSLAITAQIIDDKKRFIVECPPEVTDPDTQCIVVKIEEYE